ncbi:hypothetical protein [Mycolicibacterium sp. J2]|uniref:hypothetical protein n=1 Tax=Mycolicibacterium sp. J2 TaxID=2993511 RepID=UPI00224B35A3|nr:hypothetical protein [Mycolicibacterium sp. J2]MCX2714227.1 hypothetical protein [Mycolicibacterium sp. J2]
MAKVTTQHIGAAGELLVQYQLLKFGIDSARLTTDSGVDLVMHLPSQGGEAIAATVQVKTKLKPVPAGGKGKPTLGFPVPTKERAQWLACADVSRDAVWLFRIGEAFMYAKQIPPLLYWYIDDAPVGALRESDLVEYRLETVVEKLLGAAGIEIV